MYNTLKIVHRVCGQPNLCCNHNTLHVTLIRDNAYGSSFLDVSIESDILK